MLGLYHTPYPLDFNWRFRHWNGSTSLRSTSQSSKKNNISKNNSFFTVKEIEMLVRMEHITIPIFLILDDIPFVDEQHLMDLGMKLTSRSKGGERWRRLKVISQRLFRS